ncbi:uncharacterized protein KD926_000094 [Aspergillus affinis]|uniref:uncharacterized protein n=1 Tax=Aspergillus affinis TaxID=1070780 RepID=UPI0022FEC049|nr:uncharacterized protein KD926_000094 [Aspergillus affinis]KAI9037678.1 hypothetical protein KD926_000094 [Aspergillus affinis]
MNLDASIQALVELVPGLTTSISPQGRRLVSHPNYEGLGDLDTIGGFYLSAAERCTTEHASFDTRLAHLSLEQNIYDLYCSSEDALRDGVKAGMVTRHRPENMQGCLCCQGHPPSVILARFHEGNALFFEEEEYKRVWGDEYSIGTRRGVDHTWLMASKAQAEAAKQRQGESRAESLL